MTLIHPHTLDVRQFIGAKLIDVRYEQPTWHTNRRTWFLFDHGRAMVFYASGSIWVHQNDEAPAGDERGTHG